MRKNEATFIGHLQVPGGFTYSPTQHVCDEKKRVWESWVTYPNTPPKSRKPWLSASSFPHATPQDASEILRNRHAWWEEVLCLKIYFLAFLPSFFMQTNTKRHSHIHVCELKAFPTFPTHVTAKASFHRRGDQGLWLHFWYWAGRRGQGRWKK